MKSFSTNGLSKLICRFRVNVTYIWNAGGAPYKSKNNRQTKNSLSHTNPQMA